MDNADDPDDTSGEPAQCVGLSGDSYFQAHTSSAQYKIESCSDWDDGQKYTATCISNCQESQPLGPYEGGYGSRGTWTTGDAPGDVYWTYEGTLTAQQLQACKAVFTSFCPSP